MDNYFSKQNDLFWFGAGSAIFPSVNFSNYTSVYFIDPNSCLRYKLKELPRNAVLINEILSPSKEKKVNFTTSEKENFGVRTALSENYDSILQNRINLKTESVKNFNYNVLCGKNKIDVIFDFYDLVDNYNTYIEKISEHVEIGKLYIILDCIKTEDNAVSSIIFQLAQRKLVFISKIVEKYSYILKFEGRNEDIGVKHATVEKIAGLGSQIEIIKDQLTSVNVYLREGAIKYNMVSKIKNHNNLLARNIVQQIQSFISLSNFLNFDKNVYQTNGWPISPDIGISLIEEIFKNDYTHVVELGSGTSTLVISSIISKLGDKNKTVPIFQSLEHKEEYRRSTIELLKSYNLYNFSNVLLSEMKEYSLDKEVYRFYDLKTLNFEKEVENPNILVLVDGPPASTNRNARYPAVPLFLELLDKKEFSRVQATFMLDDYKRDEEKEIFNSWIDFTKTSFRYEFHKVVNNEKGLGIITFSRGLK